MNSSWWSNMYNGLATNISYYMKGDFDLPQVKMLSQDEEKEYMMPHLHHDMILKLISIEEMN